MPHERAVTSAQSDSPDRSDPPGNAPLPAARMLGAMARTILVVDRRLGDRAGSWVVTPLVTEGGTVAVLRGFVDGLPATPPAAPEGVVTVEGSLGPTESPRPGAALPAPQRRSVDLAALVNEWPGDLYNLLVLASSETPSAGAAAPIKAAPRSVSASS